MWDIQGTLESSPLHLPLSAAHRASESPRLHPPPSGNHRPRVAPSHPASSPPHASHSVQSLCLPRELHICPAHSHRAPLYCSSISRLEHHTSLFQDPFRDGPQ